MEKAGAKGDLTRGCPFRILFASILISDLVVRCPPWGRIGFAPPDFIWARYLGGPFLFRDV